MTTNLNLYFSPIKMVKMSVISICILILGIYCLRSDIITVKMIGLVEIILGFSTLLIALKSSFNKNPQIIIDEKGIIDNRILKNFIPWSQIQNSELTLKNNQKVLKLIIPKEFSDENFKWLYVKTSKLKLNEKPRNLFINLDHLKVNYKSLNEILAIKQFNYESKNLDYQINGLVKLINKIFY